MFRAVFTYAVVMPTLDMAAVLQGLAINLIAATVLVYGLYFRRHRRRDLVLGLMAFNLSLFVVSAALASAGSVSLGVGFGLFAVLSIVRLRSDEATQAEIGFTMVALVLGLINGLPTMDWEFKALFSALLVVGMYVVDHKVLLSPEKHQRFFVTTDFATTNQEELVQRLEEQLGCTIDKAIIARMNILRGRMTVDVRTRNTEVAAPPEPPAAPTGSSNSAGISGVGEIK